MCLACKKYIIISCHYFEANYDIAEIRSEDNKIS